MANFEERIHRMEQAGTLSAQQAEEMRRSIRSMGKVSSAGIEHKALPLVLVAGIALVATLVLSIALGGNTEPEIIQNVSEIMNESGKVGAMDRGMTTGMSLFVILLPLVLSGIGFIWLYNDLVKKEEDVLASWSQVESNYQRRADLIPNLISTVKTFMEHESDTLKEVTEERTPDLETVTGDLESAQEKATTLTAVAQENLDDDKYMADLAAAQKTVSQNVSRLFGVVENYPQLRSADNFLTLQDQLEGTENRINVARMVFNDSVRDYNSAMRKMPGALVAGMGNFKRKAYFDADEGSDRKIDVDF